MGSIRDLIGSIYSIDCLLGEQAGSRETSAQHKLDGPVILVEKKFIGARRNR